MGLEAFDKVLVANRGEIACRIFRTCARLGIRTAAVYSEADRDALHVRLADEAHCVGPAAARDSYLRADRIIEVAKRTGARAIHPGYGFLSENSEFADACAREGIVFIGPPAEAIRVMGSKSAAKSLMARAGVPLVPGYHGDDQKPERLAKEAETVGYPVMIKATAGGGGKGMRIVREAAAFLDALASCRRESKAAFGDDRVLIERYLEHPRHIEVQIFADQHDNVVHLFERDCSIQRRHQKVIEEAPAPNLAPDQRASMGATAIEAARAVGYVGAGTVEFIVASDGTFYFMEMNTRLQVEHPVTEMITGLDLVEWQLRVAAAETLPRSQDQLGLRGHALEARVYAENTAKGFVPSVGRLQHLAFPAESAHVRVDTGVDESDEIGPHYDPMIAKLIVWDESRDAALRRMRGALSETRIVGVENNVGFLSRLFSHERFTSGHFDTGLIEDAEEALLPVSSPPSPRALLCAALSVVLREANGHTGTPEDPWSPWTSLDAWRLNAPCRRTIELAASDVRSSVNVEHRDRGYTMELAGTSYVVEGTISADDRLDARIDDENVEAWVPVQNARHGSLSSRIHFFSSGERAVLEVIDPLRYTGQQTDSLGGLQAPMPGTILQILVEAGTRVEKGTPLLVLEAMKMEHAVKAPAEGIVQGFHYAVGDQVAEGVELVDFEPDD